MDEGDVKALGILMAVFIGPILFFFVWDLFFRKKKGKKKKGGGTGSKG
tara:strand:+ start:19 stop:162 length:144 start_codon:yes stop_codon:yes gene_type:complete